MKKKVVAVVAILLCVAISVVAFLFLMPKKTNLVTKNFADTDEVLLNPGKGFVDYGTMIYKGAEDYVSIGYHRFNWVKIEPTEGDYHFEEIDHKIEAYKKLNKKFAFGIMCVNTSADLEYVTPQYVFEKGAKSYDAKLDSGIYQKVPSWTDPTYLECVNKFVKKLGERYNGDENIAFIDILSYGNWGEQHLYHIEVDDRDYMKKEKITPEFFKENYVKPYMEAFPDTLLFNPWGEEDFNDVYEQLIDEGVSLRRDGIVKYTNGLDMLEKCYGKMPVVFEYAGNYKDYIPDREAEFNQKLQEAIDIAKPSYIELDEDWFEHNKEYCAYLANKMGYYFRLKQAQFYANIKRSEQTNITLTFANDGIAPIYEKCFVYVGFLDEDGKLVKKYLTNLTPKTWLPGTKVNENVKINFGEEIDAGEYSLAVGLFKNETDENPTYLLGSEGGTENKWYVLGDVNIVE